MLHTSNALEIWVIYDKPKDFPDHFVARKWLNDTPTQEVRQSDSLEALRRMLPEGLYRQPRDKHDDLTIVESWF